MKGWLESVVGPDYATALMWTVVALIILLVLLVLIRILRGFGVATFVSGGRNRKARLAVMDATAVDSHRRLVLVRRDDVEHLILIGGPTDVVVEQNIRLNAPMRRAATGDTPPPRHEYEPKPAAEPSLAQPQTPPPAPAPAPAPAQPVMQPVVQPASRPAPQPAAQAGRQALTQPSSMAAPVIAPAVAPLRPLSPAPEQRAAQPVPSIQPSAPVPAAPAPVVPPAPVVAPVPAAAPAPVFIRSSKETRPDHSDIDQALLDELEMSLDGDLSRQETGHTPIATSNPESNLDEEMSRLLNDLAKNR